MPKTIANQEIIPWKRNAAVLVIKFFLSNFVPIMLVSALSLSSVAPFATSVASYRSFKTFFVHLDDELDLTNSASRKRRF